MARLFIAVRPPPDVLATIGDLPRPSEPGVRWVTPEQWHVTVRFLGDTMAVDVIDVLEAATPAVRAGAPIEATIGPSVSRLGRQVICLPVHGLDGLAATVAAATAEVGEPVDPRPFHGHLTLARLRHRGACGLAGHPFSARFEVKEFELVSSVVGHRGARHAVVRAFSLSG